MALVAEVTSIICVADSSSSLQSKYFKISGVGSDFEQNNYYVWIDVASGGTDPGISGTGIEVDISADASNSTVATAVSNAINAQTDFSTSVSTATITVTNSVRGSVTNAVDVNTGFTISTTTEGTGVATSTYSNPEDFIAWFITGDHLAITTTNGADNDTVHQRLGDYKPIDTSLINGVLIHYSGEPNAVSAITDTPDIDNSMHSSLIDYVKFRLYQDKAGISVDSNASAVAMSMAKSHEGKWNEAIRRYGMKKRDKTGAPRRIMPADLR
jgi:hypothetical protein|tara:strand:- start:3 stop:812 length:810 start_codon:yes stop_codon:yes gene_type:complete